MDIKRNEHAPSDDHPSAENGELPYEAGCDYCNHPLFIGRKCKACGKEFWYDEEETHD